METNRRASVWGIRVVVLLLSSTSSTALAQQAEETTLTAAQRKSLAITIYNNGLGLVREAREIALPRAPRARLRFEDVSPSILAPSVSLLVSPNPKSVRVLEQSYRYDLLSPRTLTERAEGAPITLLRTHPGTGDLARVRGEVLASFTSGTPVLRTGEGITFYSPGAAMAFDKLPERWSSRPSLGWLLEVVKPGPATFQVAYLTSKMSWEADYVLTLPRAASATASLVGWITLTNSSGLAFPSSRIAVVAGQVHTATPTLAPSTGEEARDSFKSDAAAQAPIRSTLGEYHLYDLPEKTDLPDQSSKQVEFVSTIQLHPRHHYLVDADTGIPDGVRRGATTVTAVDTEIRFDVKESEGLGVPLPQGTVRVFALDSQDHPQFIGERSIAHTPRDEVVKLRLGPAPEIRLTRILRDRVRGFGRRDDTLHYRLRNSKSTEVTVEVRERNGKLVRSSVPATHPDAATTLFEIKVPAGGEVRWDAEYREGP